MNSPLILSSPIRRFLPTVVLAGVGVLVGSFLAQTETAEVRNHLAGFPDAIAAAHQWRPLVLFAICLIPALTALYYALVSSLDRYLIRHQLGAFALCFTSIYAIWFISDLTNHASEFSQSPTPFALASAYYLAGFPKIFVEFAPFALLLAILYSLGKLSKANEIVAMIQTGRSVARLTFPMLVIGCLIALVCLGFNFQWAPSAIAYQNALLEQAEKGSLSRARNVVYFSPEKRRLWFIESFPFEYHRGEPLENITIRSFSADGKPQSRLFAERAQWNRETQQWTFEAPQRWDLTNRFGSANGPIFPKFENDLPPSITTEDWSETPWTLIKPALKADELGIPGLYTWLVQNRTSAWGDQRKFFTQWHFRWAQPAICLAIVLLAAPLGIVFTRRARGGGVAVAIFLCAGILFSSTVFLALGESGYLPPLWAAWGTNLLATLIALWLIHRRLVGQSIYQSLRKLLPFS